jgi:hypothetical protein
VDEPSSKKFDPEIRWDDGLIPLHFTPSPAPARASQSLQYFLYTTRICTGIHPEKSRSDPSSRKNMKNEIQLDREDSNTRVR